MQKDTLVACHQCLTMKKAQYMIHLQNGDFICMRCWIRDKKIRQKIKMPEPKLMISPKTLNRFLIK
jgi:hypothetical protein